MPCAEAELLLLFLLGGWGSCRGRWKIWSLGWKEKFRKGDWSGEKGETRENSEWRKPDFQPVMDNRLCMFRLRRREEEPSPMEGSRIQGSSFHASNHWRVLQCVFSSLLGADIDSANLSCDCTLAPSPAGPSALSGPLTRRALRSGWQPSPTCPFPWLLKPGQCVRGFHSPPVSKSLPLSWQVQAE